MVMFNGAKSVFGHLEFSVEECKFLESSTPSRKVYTMSIHFLQKSCMNLARQGKSNALTCKILQDIFQDIFKNYIFLNLGTELQY